MDSPLPEPSLRSEAYKMKRASIGEARENVIVVLPPTTSSTSSQSSNSNNNSKRRSIAEPSATEGIHSNDLRQRERRQQEDVTSSSPRELEQFDVNLNANQLAIRTNLPAALSPVHLPLTPTVHWFQAWFTLFEYYWRATTHQSVRFFVFL
jgi:hypothetical protein